MKYIRYIGEDLIIKPEHKVWPGKKALSKNKIYQLKFDWDGITQLNGYWTFYIYDELIPTDYRGYELRICDVETIRYHNLDLLID